MSDLATAMLGGNPPPSGGEPPAGGPQGTVPPSGAAPAGGAPPVLAPPAATGPFAWAPTLGKEVTDLLAAKGFDKDPNLLANSYYHANKALSGAKDVIALPADDAPPEAWDKFNEARGVPKTPDEYDFKFGENVPVDDEFAKFGKEFFRELGVPKGKAQAAIDKWQDFAGKRMAALNDSSRQANENELKALETANGKEKWNALVAQGQLAFKSLGLPADVLAKVEANVGAAAVVQLMGALGAKIPKEGAVLTAGGGGAPTDPTQMTLAQLEDAKNTLMGDKDFMEKYNNPGPQHDDAVKRVLHINEQITARRRAVR